MLISRYFKENHVQVMHQILDFLLIFNIYIHYLFRYRSLIIEPNADLYIVMSGLIFIEKWPFFEDNSLTNWPAKKQQDLGETAYPVF